MSLYGNLICIINYRLYFEFRNVFNEQTKMEHLSMIAESMYEWEGRIAENLGLTVSDVFEIKRSHPNHLSLQL